MATPEDESTIGPGIGPSIGTIAPSLLSRPLDFIAADHVRQRRLCAAVEGIADAGTADPKLVEEILAHIRDDLGPHIDDEEQDLFPLLRRRCDPEDEIDLILRRLDREHAEDKSAIATLVDDLTRLLAPDAGVDAAMAARLRAFARSFQRHLAIENGAVLPLARARLTRADLANLAKRMAARRGRSGADTEPEGHSP